MVYRESIYIPPEVVESPEAALEAFRAARETLSADVMPSIAETEISTGQRVKFVSLANHIPQTENGLLPIPAYFVQVDPDQDLTLNREHTNPAKLQQYVSDYLKSPAGLNLIESLAIEDTAILTPQEGIQLSMKIVTEHLQYDRKLAEDPFKTYRDADIYAKSGRIETTRFLPFSGRISPDYMGTTELLTQGLGVCRNYAEATITVFQALKDIQSKKSQLLNTHLKIVESKTSDTEHPLVNKAKNSIMDKHRWVEAFTVQSDGSILASVIDPTFLDSRGIDEQDQTVSRYALSLLGFYQVGLMSHDDLIASLQQGLAHQPSESVEALLEALDYAKPHLQEES